MNRRGLFLSRYMTLKEAATLLGMGSSRHTARRLGRIIRRQERRLKVTVLHRDKSKKNSPALVTLATLRHHLPELFDSRSETLELVRENLRVLTDNVAELRLRDKALAARIRQNTQAINQLLEASQSESK